MSNQLFRIFILLQFICFFTGKITLGQTKYYFNHEDSLRGSIGTGRSNWDVLHYEITITPDISNKTISGCNHITFKDAGTHQMQLDLQEPMLLDSVTENGQKYDFNREGNVYWLNIAAYSTSNVRTLNCYFHGKPREAVNPPWDGGWIWKKDAAGNPFISVACQGLGASVWYPCKDHQSDEPNLGCTMHIITPDTLVGVGNGKLINTDTLSNHRLRWNWTVQSPINNYNIVPYIGKYSHWQESYRGKNGLLSMDYYVLSYNLEKAKKQFADAPKMMKAFEYWLGPYPFYQDGYKLVEAPHLGMEHQSAIAYGNKYTNGYMGRDRSTSGWGMKWDFIIIHESGHEWFANNITAKDIADMWIHESFTNYTEALYIEYYFGKKAAQEYVQGLRGNISNDRPIIGPYGVNTEGSSDMYDKGCNLIHLIRTIMNNDRQFRNMLIGMNKKFHHQTITTEEMESYISQYSKINFAPLFNQYLRDTRIPVLNYMHGGGNELIVWWSNCIDGFNMPVKISLNNQKFFWIHPTTDPQPVQIKKMSVKAFTADSNFYIGTHRFIP